MELDEDDEVNEGHADKVQKVGSRSGMDQCSADESVRAIQRQFAVLRSPQKRRTPLLHFTRGGLPKI